MQYRIRPLQNVKKCNVLICYKYIVTLKKKTLFFILFIYLFFAAVLRKQLIIIPMYRGGSTLEPACAAAHPDF